MVKTPERILAKNRKWYQQNKDARRASIRAWHKANPEKTAKYSREALARARKRTLDHYGNECACCGEVGEQFLTIDHINGDGAAHRRKIGGNLYNWLRRNGYPKGFRTLCFNCNCALGLRGFCH